MPSEKKNLLNLSNARTPEQKKLMRKIIHENVCPFCPKFFKKYHPKPILKETEYWFFTENMSPYTGTKYHFLLVYKKKHVTQLNQLTPQGMADLGKLLTWAVKKYKIPGGAFFMRFGDTRYNGSSVAHLHTQLLMGDIGASGHEPVKVKLG